LYEPLRPADDIACDTTSLLPSLVRTLIVDGCDISPTRVKVGLPEVRTADDGENLPREDAAAKEALDTGTAPDGNEGACVVTVAPLRLTTDVKDELGDWERGVCLTGADTMVLTGS